MPVSTEIRKNYLTGLIKKAPKTMMKVPYKGKTAYMGVWEVDRKYLIYNRHNGRLETEMATWEAEDGVVDAPYDDALHAKIENFLWNTNQQRNKHTLEDIRVKAQLVPGAVTLDGVIIDGNRRAMLLGKLRIPTFDAVILPDTYAESEEWIVRLETQFQLAEDKKLEYGPLEKYLKVKRLHDHLGIGFEEISELMGIAKSEPERLHEIMNLMDDYLNHIECPGLYKLLRDSDGTKEGMFVDLYQDLKRFEGNTTAIEWVPDKMTYLLDLKTLQFDIIRYGDDFSGTEKDYRKISHEGGGKKSFFAHEHIWKKFSDQHRKAIDPITQQLGNLDDFVRRSPGYETRVDAAIARDNEWKEKIGSAIKRNFFTSKETLADVVEQIEPKRLLERALNSLSRIDLESDQFLSDHENLELAKQINQISYEMKKRFERVTRTSNNGRNGQR